MALYGDGSNVNKTTSATVGTYGNASAVPQITVDGNQRISSINQVSITLDASINANASVGAVGTYAFLQQSSANAGAVAPGGTVAGSSMRYSDATGRDNGTGPSGNWRCMGYDSGTPLANTSNTGSASASASGNVTGSLSGGEVQGNASLQGGEVQGNASLQGGEVQGNASLQGGNVVGNTNANGSLGIGPTTQKTTKGSLSVPTNHLGVSGNVGTNGLNVSGNAGTSGLNVAGNVGTSGLDVSGNVTGTASINVSVNSVSANVTVAYSSTLWLRYS
tara:strand:- start:1412 stop:2242 length:831 start_codon:yes stop_codon:yes gene_type:complete